MENRKLINKKALIIPIIIVACLIIGFLIISEFIIPNHKYNNAVELITKGSYEEAYNILLELEDFKKAEELLEKFEYKLIKVTDPNNLSYESHELFESYEYDSQGNCTLKANVSNGDYSIIEQKTEYLYNDSNQCIKEIQTGNCDWPPDEKYENITEYIYDNSGNKIKEIHYDSDSEVNTVTLYEYENNLLVKERHYASVFGVDYLTEYFYDDSGRLLKEQKGLCVPETGIQKSRASFYYDQNGNITKKITTDNDGQPITTTYQYEYDEQNRKIKEVQNYNNGSGFHTYKYTYDSFGNLINETYSYALGDMYSSEEQKANEYNSTSNYEYKLFYFPDKQNMNVGTTDTSSAEKQQALTKEEALNIYRGKISEYSNALKISDESFEKLYPYDEESFSINVLMLRLVRWEDNPKLKYALYDIDQNGIDELIIAAGNSIIDIYSISNKKAVGLIWGAERYHIYISDFGAIFDEGSDGHCSGGCNKYYIDEDENGNISLESLGRREYDEEADFTEYADNEDLVGYNYYYEATNMLGTFEFDEKATWQTIN